MDYLLLFISPYTLIITYIHSSMVQIEKLHCLHVLLET